MNMRDWMERGLKELKIPIEEYQAMSLLDKQNINKKLQKLAGISFSEVKR